MNELIEFLTSKEIIVVYIVAAIACFLCFIIYIVDKTYQKRRQRHNTRELNKLVEEISDYVEEDTTPVVNTEPVIEKVEEVTTYTAIKNNENKTETVKDTPIIKVEEKQEENKVEELELIQEEVKLSEIEPIENIVLESMPEPIKKEEELQYTTIEPDEATAKLQLQKLTEELEKAEAEANNINLTAYEEEQESNAIISLDELVKKSKEMYEANELTQYADEGNEPISLEDLEKRMQQATIVATETVEKYNEPFIIEEVVDEIKPEEITELLEIDPVETEKVKLDDFNTVKTETSSIKNAYSTTKKFQSSPVISPIYGIERKTSPVSEIELENTANYEKLDEEIKKTNEFLMTLKELQRNLD